MNKILLPLFLAVSIDLSQAKDSKELSDLMQIHTELEQRALGPIRAKTILTLKKLAEDYTKAGKLEDAMAVRRQLGFISYGGNWFVLTDGKPFIWMSIYPDGTFVTTGNSSGTWDMEGESLKFSFTNDTTWKLSPGREHDPLSGKASNGTNLRFVRQKPE